MHTQPHSPYVWQKEYPLGGPVSNVQGALIIVKLTLLGSEYCSLVYYNLYSQLNVFHMYYVHHAEKVLILAT